VVLAAGLALCACARRQAVSMPGAPPQGGPYAAAPAGYGYAGPVAAAPSYRLDTGDRLRVTVFGQEGVSNSYLVDAGGNINVALIGPVRARGLTTQMLALDIGKRLRQGYIREPHVGVEIEAYRPFFILGEVNAPGQYPYQPHMTVETAVAIAGGYSPRADKSTAQLTRNTAGGPARGKVAPATPVHPGDTITIPERWF
jgi:polysaccharide export outer membrane protein